MLGCFCGFMLGCGRFLSSRTRQVARDANCCTSLPVVVLSMPLFQVPQNSPNPQDPAPLKAPNPQPQVQPDVVQKKETMRLPGRPVLVAEKIEGTASEYPNKALTFADEFASAVVAAEDKARTLNELYALSQEFVQRSGRGVEVVNRAVAIPVANLPREVQTLLRNSHMIVNGKPMSLEDFVVKHAGVEEIVFTRVLRSPVAETPDVKGDAKPSIAIGGATYVPQEGLKKGADSSVLKDTFVRPGKQIAFINFGTRDEAGTLLPELQRPSILAARIVHEASQFVMYREVLEGKRPIEAVNSAAVDKEAYSFEKAALNSISGTMAQQLALTPAPKAPARILRRPSRLPDTSAMHNYLHAEIGANNEYVKVIDARLEALKAKAPSEKNSR